MWDEGLKAREREFVLAFCTDDACFWNGTKAAMKATGQDEASAAVTANRLLKKPNVKTAIKLLIESVQPEADAENIFRLLHDLFIQATYNPADIIDENGQLKNSLDKMGDKAKCIAQIIPLADGVRIVLTDRDKAQTKLMKYYNLIREAPEIKAEMPVIMLNGKENDVDQWNAVNAPKSEGEQ